MSKENTSSELHSGLGLVLLICGGVAVLAILGITAFVLWGGDPHNNTPPNEGGTVTPSIKAKRPSGTEELEKVKVPHQTPVVNATVN